MTPEEILKGLYDQTLVGNGAAVLRLDGEAYAVPVRELIERAGAVVQDDRHHDG